MVSSVKKVLVFFMAVLVFWGAWVSAQAHSQEAYPTRAIDIIIPFAPGAGTDLTNRIAAAFLKQKWNVPVNVLSKPGGNTVPACLEVYGSKPDGYVVLGDSVPSSSLLSVVVKQLPFKVADRSFMGVLNVTPMLLMVPSGSPHKTLQDVIAEAKKDISSFTWTSLGGASMQDYLTRQFFKASGIDVTKTKPIMSQGGSQATTLTAGGHVKLGSGTTSGILTAFKSGMVRPLAVTGKTRHPDFPEVPTFEEIGLPTVTAQNWNGFSGPPNLPSRVVEIWDKALQEMAKDPEVISKLRNIGSVASYLDGPRTKEHVRKETEEVEKLYSVK